MSCRINFEVQNVVDDDWPYLVGMYTYANKYSTAVPNWLSTLM